MQHQILRVNVRTFCAGAGHDDKQKELKCLYDGECPLCMKEIDFLKKRDKHASIEWVDISSDNYDAAQHANIDYKTGMESMHVIDKEGRIEKGIHAFQPMYKQVGLGWIWSFTKVPILSHVSSFAYDQWAKYRMKITGRPPIEQVIKEREERMANKSN
eukprot:CAMPEP_0197022472 /NCGR_PEP_ID=MMETSP1384-20130603/3346_1 /TAXON_ID=29189 /ORGANISM="Ammonia sp." /LENGTH=157 /DNA_ID=CAMNT_0042450527 /DNA_START=53 /DNA_END=526 /DNA_ORIENTATION=+